MPHPTDYLPEGADRRVLPLDLATVEWRAAETDEDQPAQLVGLATVFNRRSQELPGGFVEEFMPGAFDDVLAEKPDVRVLFNHRPDNVLGRTGGPRPNARVWADEKALHYEATPPNTSTARDVEALVAARVLTGSSFSFTVAEGEGETWEQLRGGRMLRKVHRVSRLFDVGPVTFPAYKSARVSKRCLDHLAAELQCDVADLDLRMRRLDLAHMK